VCGTPPRSLPPPSGLPPNPITTQPTVMQQHGVRAGRPCTPYTPPTSSAARAAIRFSFSSRSCTILAARSRVNAIFLAAFSSSCCQKTIHAEAAPASMTVTGRGVRAGVGGWGRGEGHRCSRGTVHDTTRPPHGTFRSPCSKPNLECAPSTRTWLTNHAPSTAQCDWRAAARPAPPTFGLPWPLAACSCNDCPSPGSSPATNTIVQMQDKHKGLHGNGC
jgi:hypothetical protein